VWAQPTIEVQTLLRAVSGNGNRSRPVVFEPFDVLLDVGVFALEPVDLGGAVVGEVAEDDGVAPAVRCRTSVVGRRGVTVHGG
jgi:hypothetical protein